MAKYVIERSGRFTQEDLEAAGRRSVAVSDEMPGVTWIRSYVSETEGKIYCEYDAPDADAVREHARRAQIPCDRVTLITVEVNPAMFR